MTRREFQTNLRGEAVSGGAFGLAIAKALQCEFSASGAAVLSGSDGFIEGLWRFDCGELFLVQPLTGRYLEINLAPNGAWWSCVFSGVRARDEAILPPQIEGIWSSVAERGWEAGFSLSFAEIERCLGSSEGLRGNVTLILGGCPDVDPPLENLHSVARLGAVDFHRPHEWLGLDELLT